ncbi:LPS-assembly protein LptD [Magnetospirillum gryphiswaldense]|uniref:LPS-assembly protein LptD n=1 Tax=Magnetospirillum gryphiswaldense TaxID=55518 RepID=A4TUY4_9PROT|nr:LPS assembly protein LptD [Magnetospirillum gryphiswaldense]CAM74441.1 Organic solvent tolerance protein [Magnetospirillum gryphiswaldense MSR-1]
MRILRPALLAASLTAAGSALAASPADVGSWGDAWGEDGAAAPQPARPRAPMPASAPTSPPPMPTAPSPRATTLPTGPAPSDVGGWGDAWGPQQSPAAATPRQAPSAIRVDAPRMAAPTRAMPAGPRPGDIGGWGNAWNNEQAGSQPISTPRPAPSSTTAAQPLAASSLPSVSVTEDQRLSVGAQLPTGPGKAEEPVQLTADQITHDRELGIVTAKGRVEIAQINRTLVADTVSYNLKQDIIAASGNVIITEPGGEVVFADYFELTGDFKDGVASEIKVILADSSRLGAVSGTRIGGNRTDFDKGVYTACQPCRRDPGRRPLWELKAERVTHNQADQEIEYRDAWLEFAGIPVMYTPYMAHPDPTVRRRTGFLMPSAGMSSNLGTNVSVPYFWAIDSNQDLTFTPRFLFPNSSSTSVPDLDNKGRSVLQRVVLSGEHRWAGMNGETKTNASLTADKYTADLRGHVDAVGRFDISNVWRAGYQVQRSSDDTYTGIYGYSFQRNQPWLTSRPYVEGFGRRNYALLEGFSYQGLRQQDDLGASPLVLPHATFSHVGMPSSRGGYWSVDADTLSYARSEGLSANRLSTQVAWNRPFMGRMGDMTNLTASLRGDAYHADHLDNNDGSANSGRIIPQVAATWRQPFIRRNATMPQVLEPMLMVAASPNGGNPRQLPNEDSQTFELDEINALMPNRMTGLDRVEGGIRGGYGLRWAAYPWRGGFINAQVAQGWRARKDSTFAPGQGFNDYLSDYVGRFDIAPAGNISLLNRVRLDKETLALRRNENTLVIGSPLLQMATTYLMLEKSGNGSQTFDRRHALVNTLTSRISRNWMASATVSSNLLDGGEIQSWGAKATYADECFAFVSDFRRTTTSDRDDYSGYQLTFNIVFKTLADLPLNVF